MAKLSVPDRSFDSRDQNEITSFLAERGIRYEKWEVPHVPAAGADQETILAAYQDFLNPLMEKEGYQTADVISVGASTPNIGEIRQKFLREHTHVEDEVRFFVDGSGLFWFHKNNEVFSVLCEAGDFISVPKATRHWFDLGPKPHVVAIRIFIDPAGWVANYTDSGIDAKYNPTY